MEDPLLTKSEQNLNVTIHGDSSSNDEHIVNVTANELPQHEADDEGVQPCDPYASVWIFIEFVVTLAQTGAAILFLTRTKDGLHLWIIGYTCASIATLPLLCLRFWRYSRCVTSESSIYADKTCGETMLEFFFVGWVTVFLWWVLVDPSSLDDTTQSFWLWAALIAFSCIRYVLPNFECAVGCLLFPTKYALDKLWEYIEGTIKFMATLFLCFTAGPLSTKSEKNVNESTANDNALSTDEQTRDQAEGVQWCDRYGVVRNSIEFVVTLGQIVAAIVVLILTKDEQIPQKIFHRLIIGYTCACIATLPILCWRCWKISQGFISQSRNKKMDNLKKMIEYFFVCWLVVLLWHLINNSSSLDYTSQLLGLCVVFLAISFIRDVVPNPVYAVMCFLLPLTGPVLQFIEVIEDFGFSVAYYFKIISFILGIVACLCDCILKIVYGRR